MFGLNSHMRYAAKFLQWEELYSFEKMLPILTRWQCTNYDSLEDENVKGVLFPKYIKKVRNPKGIPSYEIIWLDTKGYFKGLVPEEQLEEQNVDPEKLWSTIEPQVLVDKAYPELVETFRRSKEKPKANKRKKKQSKVDEHEELMKNNSISEPVVKKVKRKQIKKQDLDDLESSLSELKLDLPKKKVGTLDNYLRKAVFNSHNQRTAVTKVQDNPVVTSTPSKASSLDFSNFTDDDEDLDLSDIIEGIVARKPKYLDKLNLRMDNHDSAEAADCSSFFITNPVEFDLFEMSCGKHDDSGESTEEYEFDEDEFKEKCELEPMVVKDVVNEENEDSFCVEYVPLLERLKNKK